MFTYQVVGIFRLPEQFILFFISSPTVTIIGNYFVASSNFPLIYMYVPHLNLEAPGSSLVGAGGFLWFSSCGAFFSNRLGVRLRHTS